MARVIARAHRSTDNEPKISTIPDNHHMRAAVPGPAATARPSR
jgi:hypothetical protein